jgi:hypothetical protein
MPGDQQYVDEIIESLPREERVVVQCLHRLILDNIQPVTEKNNYGAPFYTRNRLMFFIWPPSIYWGSKKLGYAPRGRGAGLLSG